MNDVTASPVMILFVTCLCLACAFAGLKPACASGSPNVRTGQKYPVIIQKLTRYRKELNFLSSKIARKRRNINELNGKIKITGAKIKLLRADIDKDNLVIRKLLRRIFIIQRDKGIFKLTPINGGENNYILFYQLKTILYHEKSRLIKLITGRDKFLNMKKNFKKSKMDLKKALDGLKTSSKKLYNLINEVKNYISTVKLKYINKDNNKNKTNRLLKNKVIKLIHKINNKSKRDDIKFSIMR